jgi:polar amino acid transport system permease protein
VEPPAAAPDATRVLPARHPWRGVASAAVGVVVVLGLFSVATNERFEWDIVGQYLFSEQVLTGLVRTLELTLIAALIALVLGCVLGLMRLSQSTLLNAVSGFYIWFFRATPLLVQILVWYNLAALYPTLQLGIPHGPAIVIGDANTLITPVTAAILGLALHEAAYTAEVFRGGIQSVDRGQWEASQALGLHRSSTLTHVVMPQALRVIIPPLGNNTIHLLKSTSLVSVIGMTELLHSIQIVYARTYQTIPLLVVACIWYLAAVTVLTFLQMRVEARLSGTPSGTRSMWSRIFSGRHPVPAATPGVPPAESPVSSMRRDGL